MLPVKYRRHATGKQRRMAVGEGELGLERRQNRRGREPPGKHHHLVQGQQADQKPFPCCDVLWRGCSRRAHRMPARKICFLLINWWEDTFGTPVVDGDIDERPLGDLYLVCREPPFGPGLNFN